MLLEGEGRPAMCLACFASLLIKDIRIWLSLSSTKLNSRLVLQLAASPEDFIKVNVDDNVMWNYNKARFRGIVRDCNSLWVAGFSKSFGTMRVLHAELLAIKWGLHLA